MFVRHDGDPTLLSERRDQLGDPSERRRLDDDFVSGQRDAYRTARHYQVSSGIPLSLLARRAMVKSRSERRLRYTIASSGIASDSCMVTTARSARRHTV